MKKLIELPWDKIGLAFGVGMLFAYFTVYGAEELILRAKGWQGAIGGFLALLGVFIGGTYLKNNTGVQLVARIEELDQEQLNAAWQSIEKFQQFMFCYLAETDPTELAYNNRRDTFDSLRSEMQRFCGNNIYYILGDLMMFTSFMGEGSSRGTVHIVNKVGFRLTSWSASLLQDRKLRDMTIAEVDVIKTILSRDPKMYSDMFDGKHPEDGLPSHPNLPL